MKLLFFRPAYFLVLSVSLLFAACKPGETPEVKIPNKPAVPETMATDAFLILPGDYAQKTTVADLEARFGAANVLRKTGSDPSVVLFPDDPTRRAYVAFHEAEDFKELARISVSDPGSRWRGKHGVRIGMTLAELRKLNGKPFYFYGFDEQKRGRVHDSWSPSLGDEAKIGAFDVAESDHLYFEVELTITDSSPLKTVLPADEELSSDDPRFLDLSELIQVTGISASSSLDDEWE